MHKQSMNSTPVDLPKKNTKTTPLLIGIFAVILPPGAYLLGLSFYQGYMNAFGVEADGFPISAPDVYVFSYHTVGYFLLSIGKAAVDGLNWIFTPPILYWAVAIFLLSVGSIYWLLKTAKQTNRPREQKLLGNIKKIISLLHWKNNDFTKSVGIVGVASYVLVLLAFGAMAVALFWWLFPLSAQSKGHEIASDRIKIFLEKGCRAEEKSKWDSCFVVIDDKGTVIHEGLLIAMSDKEIAIFKKDGSYVFSRQENFLLRRTLH
jgi:hypothetical protein